MCQKLAADKCKKHLEVFVAAKGSVTKYINNCFLSYNIQLFFMYCSRTLEVQLTYDFTNCCIYIYF